MICRERNAKSRFWIKAAAASQECASLPVFGELDPSGLSSTRHSGSLEIGGNREGLQSKSVHATCHQLPADIIRFKKATLTLSNAEEMAARSLQRSWQTPAGTALRLVRPTPGSSIGRALVRAIRCRPHSQQVLQTRNNVNNRKSQAANRGIPLPFLRKSPH